MSAIEQTPWLYRVVPAFDALRRYTASDLRADTLSGLTVAAVAVPQAMAYAMVAGVPVEYGLYTAIVMTAVGALFDSSRQLINGPTNAISIERQIDEHTRVVVIRLKRAHNPDAVGLKLLEDFVDRVRARDVRILLCGVRESFAEKIERTGLAARIGDPVFREERVRLTSTLMAVRRAYELIFDRCPACPRRGGGAPDRALYYAI